MQIIRHSFFLLSYRCFRCLLAFLILLVVLSGGGGFATNSWLSIPEVAAATAAEESSGTGNLELLSEPADAEWLIDGQPQGTTPGKKSGIPTGLHQLVIKKKGFLDWHVSLEIKPGETVRLLASLKSQGHETMQSLAKMAATDMRDRRFTMPMGANALEKYQKILAMDPDNALGWDGLRQIVQALQGLAKTAKTEGHPALAQQRLQKARRVQALIDQRKPAKVASTVTSPTPTHSVLEQSATSLAVLKEKSDATSDANGMGDKAVKKGGIPTPKPIKKGAFKRGKPHMDQAPSTKVVREGVLSSEAKEEPTNKKDRPSLPVRPPDTTPRATLKSDKHADVRTQVEPVTGIEFVEIPPGCFKMGSERSDNSDPDEQPVHEVCLKGFWLSRKEVTNGQYRMFVSKHDSSSYDGHNLNGDLQPVVNVTWSDANRFARWMSGRGGVHFRLPTEAEWEYAARAGSTTTFPWGDDPAQGCLYANIGDEAAKKVWSKWNVFPCADGFAETSPVGMFLPNGFGLYDMIGNVWEWVADWYLSSYYALSTRNDPKGPATGSFRSARGGSWAVWPEYARTANRTGIDPEHPDLHVGFRLVMMPP
ncbi:MAG: SUMF1/EgtB/PvdO family nonheme iron enzyme [Magnetococcus sp. YQC-5]